MRYPRHLKAAALVSGNLFLVASFVLWWFLHTTPYGYFQLARMMPGHDSEDAVLFSGAAVTMKSCGGDMAFGSYSRDSDGSWRWRYLYQGKQEAAPPEYFHIQPGVLAIHVSSTNSGETFTLKRKLGPPRVHASNQ